jgi:hypothetical protein
MPSSVGREETRLSAIRTVLAAYRSTEAHVTKAQIEAAWAEYEGVRSLLTREREAHDLTRKVASDDREYWFKRAERAEEALNLVKRIAREGRVRKRHPDAALNDIGRVLDNKGMK